MKSLKHVLLATTLTLATITNSHADPLSSKEDLADILARQDGELDEITEQLEEELLRREEELRQGEEDARRIEAELNKAKAERRQGLNRLSQLEEQLHLEDADDLTEGLERIDQLLKKLPNQLERLIFKYNLEKLIRQAQHDMNTLSILFGSPAPTPKTSKDTSGPNRMDF